MESIKFKTNIKCDACIAKVTPGLNEAVGADNWQVDISNPAKVLTINDEQKEAKVKEALAKVGYKAERI
ncbi:MAG: heavy metal transport/detoxification protein [Chryseolinea sp.]